MLALDLWRHDNACARALTPLAALYAASSRLRWMTSKCLHSGVPVICVGAMTVGGAGKTPVVLDLARRLGAHGRRVHLLSRGYGGRARGPCRVDSARHRARDVGDEPLLLAEVAPTWVGADRRLSAAAAIAAGADVLVMDDGFQNPTLAKTLSLVVIDGDYGLGNGRVVPAGPLREPLARGLARADAVVVMGADRGGIGARIGAAAPLLRAHLVASAGAHAVADQPVYAFAGIGHPDKFFRTLEGLGCRLLVRRAFADHHVYTPETLMEMVEHAHALGARLVTTAKDRARLDPEARPMVEVVGVELAWEDPPALERLVGSALAA